MAFSNGGGAFSEDGAARVLLFVHDGCGTPCNDATAMLMQRRVEHEVVNVSEGEEQVAIWKKFGSQRQMPYLVAGNERVIGYNKWDFVSALAGSFDDQYLTATEYRVLRKNFNDDGAPKLVMYTMNGCGYCDQARSYFRAEGIAFEERNSSEDSTAQYELDMFQAGTPLIFHGYKRYVGWSEHIRSSLLKVL